MLPKHVRYQTAPHPADGGCASQATEVLYMKSGRVSRLFVGLTENYLEGDWGNEAIGVAEGLGIRD